jgi:hypothetical protein
MNQQAKDDTALLMEPASWEVIKKEASLIQGLREVYRQAIRDNVEPQVFSLYLRRIIPDTYRLTNWERDVIQQAQAAAKVTTCDDGDTQVSGAPFPEPMRPQTVLVAIICVLLSLAGFLLVYELIR